MKKKLEYGNHQYGPGGYVYHRALVDENVYIEWIVAFPEYMDPLCIDITDHLEEIHHRTRVDIVRRLSDSDLGRKWLLLKYPNLL
jgi:hypothetical protein